MITTTLLPPAPRGPGGPHPLVPLAFILGFILGALNLLFVPPARAAEIIGWRIEVTACRGAECGSLQVPTSFWDGKYACEGRAAYIAEVLGVADRAALASLGLPEGAWRFSGRCAPVLGDPRA